MAVSLLNNTLRIMKKGAKDSLKESKAFVTLKGVKRTRRAQEEVLLFENVF